MPSEVIRCVDCGTAFKGVPAWLSTASVKFSCTNCPKRPSRVLVRPEPLAAAKASVVDEDDDDIAEIDADDTDEDADSDLAVVEGDDDKEV